MALRWYGMCIEGTMSILERVMGMEIGKRKKGRQMRRWFDCIREDMIALGAHTEDSLDRRKLKEMIRIGDPA
jgi:hypothetical protein